VLLQAQGRVQAQLPRCRALPRNHPAAYLRAKCQGRLQVRACFPSHCLCALFETMRMNCEGNRSCLTCLTDIFLQLPHPGWVKAMSGVGFNPVLILSWNENLPLTAEPDLAACSEPGGRDAAAPGAAAAAAANAIFDGCDRQLCTNAIRARRRGRRLWGFRPERCWSPRGRAATR
jgi:hypothetical protein